MESDRTLRLFAGVMTRGVSCVVNGEVTVAALIDMVFSMICPTGARKTCGRRFRCTE